MSSRPRPDARQVIILENDLLRIELLPDLGAKIYSIYYKPTDREILWHPSIPPRRLRSGASYDDHWSGGWDEIFPNDEPAYPDSLNFPDHGELWSAVWQSDLHKKADTKSQHLHTYCSHARCRVEKWVTLCENESELKIRYRVSSQTDRPVPYLFNLHPAMANLAWRPHHYSGIALYSRTIISWDARWQDSDI